MQRRALDIFTPPPPENFPNPEHGPVFRRGVWHPEASERVVRRIEAVAKREHRRYSGAPRGNRPSRTEVRPVSMMVSVPLPAKGQGWSSAGYLRPEPRSFGSETHSAPDSVGAFCWVQAPNNSVVKSPVIGIPNLRALPRTWSRKRFRITRSGRPAGDLPPCARQRHPQA